MFRKFRWNEVEVLKQVKAGNEKALIALFERNYLTARNQLMQRGASDEAIREVLEDAVIDYWQAAQNNRTTSPPGDYILESLEQHWQHYQTLNNEPLTAEDENLHTHQGKLRELAKYVKMHSDACRELLSLYYFEKWDHEAIADKSGLKADEIDEKVFQCKRKLAQSVKRNISLRNLI